MIRPLRSARYRIRASAFAILSSAGLVVCAAATADGSPDAGSIYREVLARLRAGGLDEKGKPPKSSSADLHNQRGVKRLRHREWTAARREFNGALEHDPNLWEASYNLAETDLRQGNYAAARRRFDGLVARAPSRTQREFVGYKVLLTDVLAGHEEPARRFVAEADRRGKFPPAYFYLQAALARHRDQNTAAKRWLAQADHAKGRTNPEVRRLYADSLGELSLPAEEGRTTHPDSPSPGGSTTSTPARVAMVEVMPTPVSEPGQTASPAPTPGLAIRALVPGGFVPPTLAFREEMGNVPPAWPTPVPEASRRPDADRGRKDGAAASPAASPASAPAVPAKPTGKPLAETSPEVRAKFDVAQGLYTRRDCPGALRVLDEIEAIQPNVNEVRNLRALLHYELAYRLYIQQDYAAAIHELDDADEAQAVADTSNLRGLVLARQRQYDRAETAFKKAIVADPTLWAAKFNLADLPFGYRNYTEARQRFEALTAETDRTTQPRQAELTEFKVFLTLLLEGRESAARSFMSRFKPDGLTPARLYAQAALDFHGGRFERAIESVKDARKKYPPQLEAIFAESFYRVGWLTDGMATPATAVATATPVPTATAPPEEPAPVAAASPPMAEPTVAIADATPAPTPEMAATPEPPAPTVPAVSPPAVAVVDPTPEPSPVVAAATPPTEQPSPTRETAESPVVPQTNETRSSGERFVRKTLPWFVLACLLAPWVYALSVLSNRGQRKLKARRIVPLPRYPSADRVLEREKV